MKQRVVRAEQIVLPDSDWGSRNMRGTPIARVLAFVISAIAWIGIVINLAVVSAGIGNPLRAAWALLGYFTILTNLIIGIAFGIIALRGPGAVNARVLGGITISIMLVGVVFALLLSRTTDLTGATTITNILHHRVTPVLVPVFWLLFVRKGALQWRDPLMWSLYLIGYLTYALMRGTLEGRFAYGFIDYLSNGVSSVAVTALLITAAFLLTSYLLVLLDKKLSK